jgi:hypothetical protein
MVQEPAWVAAPMSVAPSGGDRMARAGDRRGPVRAAADVGETPIAR